MVKQWQDIVYQGRHSNSYMDFLFLILLRLLRLMATLACVFHLRMNWNQAGKALATKTVWYLSTSVWMTRARIPNADQRLKCSG